MNMRPDSAIEQCDGVSAVPEKSRKGITRRRLMKAAFGSVLVAGCALDAWVIEPRWVKVRKVEIGQPRFPYQIPLTIAHISDLHCSRDVSFDYLSGCVEKINSLDPDIICVTGDFVTFGSTQYYRQLESIVSGLKARYGVFGCLGNHDYHCFSDQQNSHSESIVSSLTRTLTDSGMRVLRNESAFVESDTLGGKIRIAGLGDAWADDCKPHVALSGDEEAVYSVVLTHNPDTFQQILPFEPDMILAGHTHGGQVRLPFVGPLLLPVRNRKFDRGLFKSGRSNMYVNPGLGHLMGFKGRPRFMCRPEITLFQVYT